MDETGTNLAMNRIYARSFKGTRAYGTRPYHRGKNVTLIGAMSLSGFLGAMTIEGGTSGDVFRVYVEKILLPTLKLSLTIARSRLLLNYYNTFINRLGETLKYSTNFS